MKHRSVTWIAPILLVASVSILSSQVTPQASSVAPQEPATLGELLRIDQATGAPTPLERVKVKQRKVGSVRPPGFLQPREDLVDFYIEGGSSAVMFKAGEPQIFVIRLMSPEDRYGRDLNIVEVLKHVVLSRLAKENVKEHDDRIVMKPNIPMDAQLYGKSTLGLDPKKPDRAAQSFRLTPQIALTPGEYLISLRGTHNFELIANGLVGNEDLAFGIVQR